MPIRLTCHQRDRSLNFRSDSSFTIGRADHADVVIPHPELVDLHLLCTNDDGEWTVIHLGGGSRPSLGGITMNRIVIGQGALLTIGDLRLQFDVESTEPTELGLDFVLHQSTAAHSQGIAAHRPCVLEVRQLWGEQVLATRQFAANGATVTVGGDVEHRWHVLGVDMGPVNGAMRQLLPALMPLLSETVCVPQQDFASSISTTLIEPSKDGTYRLLLDPNWDAFIDDYEGRKQLPELLSMGRAHARANRIAVQVRPQEQLVVEIAESIFVVRLTAPGARPANRVSTAPEPVLWASALCLSMVAIAFFVLTLFGTPETDIAVNHTDDAAVAILKVIPPPPPPELKPKQAETSSGSTGHGPPRQKTKPVKKPGKGPAKTTGIGILDALASIDTTAGGLSALSGDQLIMVKSGVGPGNPLGSLGNRNLAGGGGIDGLEGDGSCIGTRCGGNPLAYGSRPGNGLGNKAEAGPSRQPDEALLIGSLPRELVDGVIKRQISSIRYCYMRELSKNPQLAGTLNIKFTIAGDGTVSSSRVTRSELNATVDACVQKRINHLRFPRPMGGGVVIVSYPFVFAPQ